MGSSFNNKMFLILALFLLYYWYFYHSSLIPYPAPNSLPPKKPDPFHVVFHVVKHNTFQFHFNSNLIWEHAFQDYSYHVHGPSSTIIERDPCYHYTLETHVVAKGSSLYKYLKQHPSDTQTGHFQEHSPYAAKQQGDIFYFTCLNRRIVALNVCPSGEIYQNQRCVAVSHCTDQPNGTKLTYLSNKSKFILCNNGRESIHQCPANTDYFYHDKCISRNDLIYQCKQHDTSVPLKIDDYTLFECRDGQPHYEKCPPGTQLFEDPICEPADCVGKLDHAKVALQMASRDPFQYAPGYVECLHEKISNTVECPGTWDETLTKGDNLTLLPMVFDGEQCAVPEFCVNVTSNDPDTIVPVHEFTKEVKNWKFSEYYDRSAGYVCTGQGRKRKILDPQYRISKHFKMEPACQADYPSLLPIYNEPGQYYDCTRHQMEFCMIDEYFDGKMCQKVPEKVFQYKGIPLFHFKSLNSEAWMYPLENYTKGIALHDQCENAEFQYVKTYDVCADMACLDYTFLAMVPQFSILLPRPEESKCVFDPSNRHIRKEKVSFNYAFWNQQIWPPTINPPDPCEFGQKIKTGNFVWDRTVYATCDRNQPFVFCPSIHTTQLLEANGVYACAPPPINTYTLEVVNQFVGFATNEVKRIIPLEPNTYFHINKRVKQPEPLDAPMDVPPGLRVTLNTNQRVNLELRYRMTHPLNVAFQYDDQNHLNILTFKKNDIFHVRSEKTNDYPFNLFTYEPETHVDSFAMHS